MQARDFAYMYVYTIRSEMLQTLESMNHESRYEKKDTKKSSYKSQITKINQKIKTQSQSPSHSWKRVSHYGRVPGRAVIWRDSDTWKSDLFRKIQLIQQHSTFETCIELFSIIDPQF